MVQMMEASGCTPAAAVQMATVNPAALLGLDDRGELKPFKRADLVLFRIAEGRMEVLRTLV